MIGQKLGTFTIESKIGMGAMGAVYKASQEGKDRPAAIKVITDEHARKGNATERFRRESDILQQFRHPNIVRFLAVGRAGGILYFAMEFVPGGTLEESLETRGAMPWREVVNLAIQLCDALHYAHQRGIVHRDLKPSNLMVSTAGVLKLTDFGIAKDLDATALTGTGRTLGTAAYMAPEQIRGTPEVSHKTDLYALGCVLYQMLTGVTPYTGKTAVVLMHAHLNASVPRPSAKVTDIPLALDNLLVALMAKEPADRPWDAAAVGQSLGELKAKADRKEAVPLVFPKSGANPSRLGSVSAPDSAIDGDTRSPAKPKPRPKSKAKDPRFEGPSRSTLGLAAGLVVLVGLAAYLLWPPSQKTLYQNAAAGMAGPNRVDWIRARDEHIAELDRRFPDHPYQAETRAWRDKIDLEMTRRRASILEKPNLGGLSEPKGEAEAMFVGVANACAGDVKEGRDDQALGRWREMAGALKDRAEDRSWMLLAEERAAELVAAMTDRAQAVAGFLERADAHDRDGRPDRAIADRRDILQRYGKYTHLAPLLDRARAGVPASEGAGPSR